MHRRFQAEVSAVGCNLFQRLSHLAQAFNQCRSAHLAQRFFLRGRHPLLIPQGLRHLTHLVDDPVPVRSAAVIALPSDATGDSIRVEVHRREVVEGCQADTATEVTLDCGVSCVVVFIPQSQVGHIPLDVLKHFCKGVGALPQQLSAHFVVAGHRIEARVARQRRNALLSQAKNTPARHLAVEPGDEKRSLEQYEVCMHAKPQHSCQSHIRSFSSRRK